MYVNGHTVAILLLVDYFPLDKLVIHVATSGF